MSSFASADASVRALFGGAMSMSLPERFVDVSPFRDVPDHQEVFADADSDQSVVVEINSALHCPDADAAAEHIRELAADSLSSDFSLLSSTALPPSALPLLSPPPAHCSLSVAEMRTSKYREDSRHANLLRVHVLLVRLPQYDSDVLVILNAPQAWAEGGAVSSARAVSARANEELMVRIARTLTVRDYGLFGQQSAPP